MTFCILLGAWLGLLSTPPRPTTADLEAIQRRGTLRVLIARQARPASISVDGQRPGFDREILEGFAAARNLRLETVVVDSWKNLIPALRAGRGDVIAGSFTDTPQRRTQIAFTREVFPTQVVAINLAPRPMLTSPADLRKELVGAAPGSSMRELALAAGIPASRIRDFPGNINADVDALRAGRATTALADLPSALSAQQADANIQIGPTLGPPGSLAFGVRLEDAHLRSELDRHIANLRLSGAWSRLVVTYWGAQTLAIVERIHATRDANER